MPLPPTIQVKISSEAAGTISLTPVVAQDMKIEELVDTIVAGTGKDVARIREILQRGSFVSGASRFRWTPFEVLDSDVRDLVVSFPDPDPQRAFDAEACMQLVIRGPATPIAIDRSEAERRRIFRRRSFWDEVVELAPQAAYAGYSYKDRADIYRVTLDQPRREKLRLAARLSPHTEFARQIEAAAVEAIDFLVKR